MVSSFVCVTNENHPLFESNQLDLANGLNGIITPFVGIQADDCDECNVKRKPKKKIQNKNAQPKKLNERI